VKRPLSDAGAAGLESVNDAAARATGVVTFDGLTLETAPGVVMTPRATSERLVAGACALVDGRARVADVGTGTGALAIAIAVRRPAALVWATDLDGSAVALARANVSRFALDERVFIRFGDLLEPVSAPLDVIVANLPYLPAHLASAYTELSAEPFAAVFAPGDGLDSYRRLIREAAAKLAPTGTLLLQLHEEVLVATRAELQTLSEKLRYFARAA
jgi:release factor glutamine methyltransferase